MTICDQLSDLFRSHDQGKSNKLLELLETQDKLLEVNQQRNGEGLYLLFRAQENGGHYFNFGEITGKLYNEFGLCVHAFDKNSNGTRTVWLVTKDFLEKE